MFCRFSCFFDEFLPICLFWPAFFIVSQPFSKVEWSYHWEFPPRSHCFQVPLSGRWLTDEYVLGWLNNAIVTGGNTILSQRGCLAGGCEGTRFGIDAHLCLEDDVIEGFCLIAVLIRLTLKIVFCLHRNVCNKGFVHLNKIKYNKFKRCNLKITLICSAKFNHVNNQSLIQIRSKKGQ